jgi:hypothetical protein
LGHFGPVSFKEECEMSAQATDGLVDLRGFIQDRVIQKMQEFTQGWGELYFSPKFRETLEAKVEDIASSSFDVLMRHCEESTDKLVEQILHERAYLGDVKLCVRDKELARAAGINCGDLDNG